MKHHYKGEYLARLQKLLDTDGFDDIQNPYANPTRKIRNAVYDFQHKLHDKYVNTNPLGHLHIYKKRPMLTMAILRVKYICKYTGPETTDSFEAQMRIKSVEKDLYDQKRATVPVDHPNEIGLDDEYILGKKAPNPIIPGFILMKLY
jgi:hypothetical protein